MPDISVGGEIYSVCPMKFSVWTAWKARGLFLELTAVPELTSGGVLPMAVKRVIKGVHVVPMGFANAFLIEGDDGLTLIDAGFPRKEAVVFGAIRGLGRSPAQLKQLMFTHGHPDHIGSAAAIVREPVRELTCTRSISL
jgi:beta-lactamase superfamily II metal-dependent hydrolase